MYQFSWHQQAGSHHICLSFYLVICPQKLDTFRGHIFLTLVSEKSHQIKNYLLERDKTKLESYHLQKAFFVIYGILN